MKRVVFVSDIFGRGGPSVWLRRLCRYLPDAGWECKLIMAEPAISYDDDWSEWPSEQEILPRHYSVRGLVRSIANAIRKFSPQVVMSGAPWGTAALAMRHLYVCRQITARFLETVITEDEVHYNRVRGNSDIVALVAACSDDSVLRVESIIPQLQGRVRRFFFPVPYPLRRRVDLNERGPLRIAYLGRLVADQKRILDLPLLVDKLAQKGTDFTLTVIGDGADRVELERLLATSRGRERVTLLGWLPSAKALEVVAESEVQLLLSAWEGQPIATLESMALGLVPVVTDLPGLREVIRHGTTGFLLRVGDIEAFASSITTLAEDRKRVLRMAVAAQESIPERARMPRAIDDFSALLDETASAQLPTPDAVVYPPTRMDRLHVPQFVQELKRRCLGQSVY